MTTAAKTFRQPRGRASIARKKAVVEQFWIRPANRELDRAGDFILKNLPGIRKEAASRASAA